MQQEIYSYSDVSQHYINAKRSCNS